MRLPDKPPATLALVAAMVVLYVQPEGLADWIPSTSAGCLQPFKVLERRDLRRLTWSPFLHADDMHLYWNMMSLLWKGVVLEPVMGTPGFVMLILQLLAGCQVVYLMLAWVAAAVSPALAGSYYSTCAVGFSGVLFALKVVLNSRTPGSEAVYGIRVPAKWVCWVELVAVSLLTPNVSFLGHLAGILTGLGYLIVTAIVAPRDQRGPSVTAVGRGGSAVTAAARKLWRLLTRRRHQPFQGAPQYAGGSGGDVGDPPWSDGSSGSRDRRSRRSMPAGNDLQPQDIAVEVRRQRSAFFGEGSTTEPSRATRASRDGRTATVGSASAPPETTQGWPTPPGVCRRWWRPTAASGATIAAAAVGAFLAAAVASNPGADSFGAYAANITHGVFGAAGGSAMRAVLKLHGRSRVGGLKLSDWGAFSLACLPGGLCFVGAFGRWLPLPSLWLVRRFLPRAPLAVAAAVTAVSLVKMLRPPAATVLHLEVGPSSHLWAPLLAGFSHDTVMSTAGTVACVLAGGALLPPSLPFLYAFFAGGALAYALLWAAHSLSGTLLWNASGGRMPMTAVLTLMAVCYPTDVILRPQKAVAKLEQQIRGTARGTTWLTRPLIRAVTKVLFNRRGQRQHSGVGSNDSTWRQITRALGTLIGSPPRRRSGTLSLPTAWTQAVTSALPRSLTAQQLLIVVIIMAFMPSAIRCTRKLLGSHDGAARHGGSHGGRLAERPLWVMRLAAAVSDSQTASVVAPHAAAIVAGLLMSKVHC